MTNTANDARISDLIHTSTSMTVREEPDIVVWTFHRAGAPIGTAYVSNATGEYLAVDRVA